MNDKFDDAGADDRRSCGFIVVSSTCQLTRCSNVLDVRSPLNCAITSSTTYVVTMARDRTSATNVRIAATTSRCWTVTPSRILMSTSFAALTASSPPNTAIHSRFAVHYYYSTTTAAVVFCLACLLFRNYSNSGRVFEEERLWIAVFLRLDVLLSPKQKRKNNEGWKLHWIVWGSTMTATKLTMTATAMTATNHDGHKLWPWRPQQWRPQIDPQAEFFRKFGWLKKSADIRISKLARKL